MFANSEHPTFPRLHHNKNYAALDSRSIQPLIDRTLMPEVKMVVGGVRSTQYESFPPVVLSLSNHEPPDWPFWGG